MSEKRTAHTLKTPTLDWSDTDNFICGDWAGWIATKQPDGTPIWWGFGCTKESNEELGMNVAMLGREIGEAAERAYNVYLREWGLKEYEVCPECGEKKLIIHDQSPGVRYPKTDCQECTDRRLLGSAKK